MPIGARLREERERLGLSQPAFAALVGTTKQTLFSWEKGKTAPDGFQLAALVNAGVDVMYVLTGHRTQCTPPTISAADRALLNDFHAAPVQVQTGVKTTLSAFATPCGAIKKRRDAA